MFTGIIQAVSVVKKNTRRNESMRLRFDQPASLKISLGDSVAINGVCLTVDKKGKDFYEVELMPETLKKTIFGSTVPKKVNIETSLKYHGLVGGHFVTGHVDTVGRINSIKITEGAKIIKVTFPRKYSTLVVAKGSVAINGVSLTVVTAGLGYLSASLVDYTLRHTTFGQSKVGDVINIEFDILAKYISNIIKKDEKK